MNPIAKNANADARNAIVHPAQAKAGGGDRLPGDQGGHYVCRRFRGPTETFNHFARDGNFNRSAYFALENLWQNNTNLGKKVIYASR
ncbi:DNA/RNA non-specific endonuclease [Sphingomonas sp. PB4P5]|uniref:DNA/RNA non-specific endonuclease n=1 Tax=Parasphingomonas puruogangriensis TaxID=3096155 RepID=UPI002FCA52D1